MKNRPPLSIPVAGSSIVPIMVFSCGHEHYSQEGIMSALQQTFNKIEFLVFVDEPQDNSAAIISSLGHSKVWVSLLLPSKALSVAKDVYFVSFDPSAALSLGGTEKQASYIKKALALL